MILGRDQHPASACFEEVNAAVEAMTDRVVCFNAHAFPAPPGAIVYNLENVPGQVPDPAERWKGHEVWDFSASNAAKYGAKHVPVGYHPSMERFERAADCPIDVVFTGCMNSRRARVLTALRDWKLRVVHLPPGVYGAERDDILARSKLALNMLFYGDGVFPALRVAHLVANRVPVLSEACREGWDFVSTCDYGEIVPRVLRMLKLHPNYLALGAADALADFKSKPMELPT